MLLTKPLVKVCNHCDHTVEVGVFSRQGELMWSRDMPAEVGHICVPSNLRNCYAVKVRPAARVSDKRLDDSSAEACDTRAEAYDTRAEAYEWSERILLPLRSQPSSLEWSLVTCLPEGAVYDAAELDLSVTSEAGAQGLLR